MYKTEIQLLGHDIKRGESVTLELEMAKLHTRHSIHVPIIVNRAKKDGPVLLLLAGIHGDEINGVAIVRKIIREKFNRPDCGTIICIPVLNVFGYLNINREFSDGRDLNRVFPGSPNGSLASQFAYHFIHEIIPVVDYIIDFHTGGADRENVPQIRCDLQKKETFNLAKIFAPPFIMHSKLISKSFRESIDKMGKTLLLFEGGKSKNLDNHVVECGVLGSLNVMKHLGMKRTENFSPQVETVIINKSKWIRAPYSGMFHVKAQNGAFVKKGSILGLITDPYGSFERKVKSPLDCYIICANTNPIANKGDALFHISIELLDDTQNAIQ